jgi:hypothetical protein
MRRSSSDSFYDRYDFEPLKNPVYDESQWQLPLEVELQQKNAGLGGELKRLGWHILDTMQHIHAQYLTPKKPTSNNPYGVWKPQQQQPQQPHNTFHSLIAKLLHLPLYMKFMFVGAFCIGVLFGYDLNVSKTTTLNVLETQQQKSTMEASASIQPQTRSTKELLGALSKEKAHLWSSIYANDFGPFRGMVFDKILLRRIFVMNDLSRERLVRKMMLKVLEGQTLPLSQKSQFTWVTTGDSAAAAHGNMYSQSYTAVLEETVRDAFGVVGIDFKANNYGIGGANSGAETSMCMQALYGSTSTGGVDVLSWDYGRTDRGEPYDKRVHLWAQRASMLNGGGNARAPPVLFMMDSSERSAWSYLSQFEQSHGLSTILMDELAMGKLFNGRVPDSLAQNNIPPETIPIPIRYLMCNGNVEGVQACDDPSQHYWCDTPDPAEHERCRAHKYNVAEFCPATSTSLRFGKETWNPGWKQHLFVGRLLGFALLEILQEALGEIQALTPKKQKDPKVAAQALLESLRAQELSDHIFSLGTAIGNNSFLPTALSAAYKDDQDQQQQPQNIDPAYWFQNPNVICRTAMLPSQSALAFGLRQESIDASKLHHSSALPLVFDPMERPPSSCEGLKFDFRDYFAVLPTNGGGEVTTTQFPSDVELALHAIPQEQASPQSQPSAAAGLLLLCPRYCDFTTADTSNCHDENVLKPHEWIIGSEDSGEPAFQITVDGVPATKLTSHDGCYFLLHQEGPYWNNNRSESQQQQQQNPQSLQPEQPHQYTLAFSSPHKQVQISSMISL